MSHILLYITINIHKVFKGVVITRDDRKTGR